MPTTCAIIPAAGRGLRMGRNTPKQFLEFRGRPLLAHTLDVVLEAGFLSGIFLVVPRDFVEPAKELVRSCLQADIPVGVIEGGAERQDSVLNGLRQLPSECDWVLIHDGVRPFVSPDLLQTTWKGAQETGAAIAALPSTDTVKRVRLGRVVETVPREEVWLVQTPQVFRKDLLLSAYDDMQRNRRLVTDDASLVERLGIAVRVVPGEAANIKITKPEDLLWAEWYCSQRTGI